MKPTIMKMSSALHAPSLNRDDRVPRTSMICVSVLRRMYLVGLTADAQVYAVTKAARDAAAASVI